ncbi:DUF4403 family protein [Tardiphaga alba]|uniref:DUF4403 family protein n=1 Tax=Tardiphaga alba TaxID=340268 RepID=UPI001BA787D6|nr:DUF4403 family protein [Tardiphaga alba]
MPTVAFAADKPPLGADQAMPAITTSQISAIIEFGIPAINNALARRVPKVLASFDDRTTSCWQRRILGRMVNVDCTYSGEIERTGPVSMRAESGRLVASTPLFGSVEAQGTRGFARMLKGGAEGAMTVYASARPQLRQDWSVTLDMSEGFRWQEPPELQILGFRINMSKYVEPKIRAQLAKIQGDVTANIRALNIKAKATQAWQKAFANVQIVDTPPIWVQTMPQGIAFSGVRAQGNVLEGSAELTTTTQTFIGTQPPAPAPTPLPALGSEVSAPGRFEVLVPVSIAYAAIKQQVQTALAASAAQGGPGFADFDIYPSNGKLVVGLRLSSPSGPGDWVYLTATPQPGDDGAVQFPDLALQADAATIAASDVAALLSNNDFLQQLKAKMALDYKAEHDRLMTSANAKLSRPLSDGFRSEVQLASAGVSKIALASDALQVQLRAAGRLKLLYGM